MKAKQIVGYGVTFLIIILIFIGCNPNTTIATINIKVIDDNADSVHYYVSKDGFWAYSLWGWNTVFLDSTGSSAITIDDDIGNVILIMPSSAGVLDRIYLYVRPGEEYDVTFNMESSQRVTIHGQYAEGQKLYTEYFNKKPPGVRFPLLNDFYSDTIPQNMLVKLEGFLKDDLQPFDILLEERKIDKEFYSIAKTQIEYSYMNGLMSILARRNYAKKREWLKYADNVLLVPIQIKNPGYKNLLAQIFEKYPHDNPLAKSYDRFNMYLLNYLWYKGMEDDLIDGPWDRKEKILACAESFLNEELFEFYYAVQFQSYSIDDSNGAMEERFEDFKSRFPDSPYLPKVTETVNMWPPTIKSRTTYPVDTTKIRN